MAKHKHAEMIKAKADNMDLVVLRKNYDNSWGEINCHDCCFMPDFDYFLCLPQHKEACLHWLNGGDVQARRDSPWANLLLQNPIYLDEFTPFMDDCCEIRIKPRKEKRWICINDNLEIEDGTLYESYSDADENSPGYKQIVEIEVEI